MLTIEHVVLASPEQMEFVIEGMRNPMNSWDKSDSIIGSEFELGAEDRGLMKRLAEAGTDHRKFMRMMPVYARITGPLYWWKEFDTYKVGTVANSCSTMHKIHSEEFTLDDFSHEHIDHTNGLWSILYELEEWRKKYNETSEENLKKYYWWQIIQLLPSSYNQTRNVMMNYEVLANIYKSRRNHKLDEWHTLCDWIEELPYSDLITGGAGNDRT